MAEQITCPHCKGTGVNYVIAAKDDKPSIESVQCAVCSGSGTVSVPDPEPEPQEVIAEVQEAELWPILVPLGIFSLFFIFLLI